MKVMKNVASQMKNQRGQGLVEYVLAIVLMGLLAIGALRALGTKTHNAFFQAGESMDRSTSKAAGDGDSTGRIGGD